MKYEEKNCKCCSKEYAPAAANQLYCSRICANRVYWGKYWPGGLNPAHVGTLNELVVAVDLLSKGWFVFRALSPSSPCDLVGIYNKKLYSIEVAASYKIKNKQIVKASKGLCSGRYLYDIMACVCGKEIKYFPDLPI